MNEWKDKTCDKCCYRDKGNCRRCPPSQAGFYPSVDIYTPACAEYRETE